MYIDYRMRVQITKFYYQVKSQSETITYNVVVQAKSSTLFNYCIYIHTSTFSIAKKRRDSLVKSKEKAL